MTIDTKPIKLTKWKFYTMANGELHQSNGVSFRLFETTAGWLYKWNHGNKWYSAQLKTKEATWVFHKLVEGHHLDWAVLDKENLM